MVFQQLLCFWPDRLASINCFQTSTVNALPQTPCFPFLLSLPSDLAHVTFGGERLLYSLTLGNLGCIWYQCYNHYFKLDQITLPSLCNECFGGKSWNRGGLFRLPSATISTCQFKRKMVRGQTGELMYRHCEGRQIKDSSNSMSTFVVLTWVLGWNRRIEAGTKLHIFQQSWLGHRLFNHCFSSGSSRWSPEVPIAHHEKLLFPRWQLFLHGAASPSQLIVWVGFPGLFCPWNARGLHVQGYDYWPLGA